jgi:exonuclease VII small subunit
MKKTDSQRIEELESEVEALKQIVAKLESRLKKLDKSIHPLSPRVRVIGTPDDHIQRSMRRNG